MFYPGLKGITAVETALSRIDGENGILEYRGISIQNIVKDFSYEKSAFYLLYGTIPDENELNSFQSRLKEYRKLPEFLQEIIVNLPPSLTLMDVLRTSISSIVLQSEDLMNQAAQLIGAVPTIIAYRYRSMNHLPIIEPDNKLRHVENFLFMLTGNVNIQHARMLEAYMVMAMEHGLNASTFSARVTISTQSDLVSAVTSAIGTMKGPLHGGAPSGVIDLLDEIKTENRICEVIHKKLKNNQRIMGFGHRVYKTVDPRAESLKNLIMDLDDQQDWIKLALKTEKKTIEILQQAKPGLKLYTNVEYYAAAIMKTIELEPVLFTTIFSSSRIVGWCAHAMEQANNNTIFRPMAKYIGK